MRRPPPFPFARIITPIQAEERTWQHLELGAAIAKELQAELRALFMRDADALAAAALPVTQTISFHSGVLRPFDVQMLEAAYRAQAARLRNRVDELCRAQALHHWSFEIDGQAEPPQPAPPVSETTAPNVQDLLLLDPSALSVPRLARRLLQLASRHAMIGLWHREALKPSRVVLFSNGDAGALAVAFTLAEQLDIPLDVAIFGDTAAERAVRLEQVRAQFLAEERSPTPSLSVVEGHVNLADLASQHRGALILFDHLGALGLA